MCDNEHEGQAQYYYYYSNNTTQRIYSVYTTWEDHVRSSAFIGSLAMIYSLDILIVPFLGYLHAQEL